MKISIVTAVYNRRATIAQAIASVQAQTWPHVEHLVIDGASTDGTLAVVERARHQRMRLVSEPDTGIYDALNKGVALATGDVVGLMHSDDFFAHCRVLEKGAAAFGAPWVFLWGRLACQRYLAGSEGPPADGAAGIRAYPRNPNVPYTRVEFAVSPDGAIQRLAVTGADGSLTEFRFTGERINVPVDDALFRFEPPPGVPVVEADEP